VKVLDFGLAKAMEADPVSGSPVNSPTLTIQATQAGQIMGTAAYMAPEQARGKAVDRRADIWAFGVVLYEMLTGESMFAGETVSDTLAAVLRADIDLKRLPPETPPRLRRLIQRCLERDPKRRLRDIGDAWIEFDAPEEVAAVVGAPAARVSPVRRWGPWIAAALAGAAGIAWGVLHTPAAPARTVARFSEDSKAVFVAVSPDSSMLAWSESRVNQMQLMLRRMDQFGGKPIPGGEGGFFASFSPDGQWLLFSTLTGKIEKIPITGGSPIVLGDGNTWFGSAWLPDDTIVFGGGKGLSRMPASGGAAELLTTTDTKHGEVAHTHPQDLGGGRVLFTVHESANYLPAHAAILDLKTKKVQTLPRTGLVTRYVPTGHLTYMRAGTLFALPFDLARGAATGPEAPVVDGVSGVGPPGYADYAFSPAGILAYAAGAVGAQGTTLAWADRKGAIENIAPDPVLWGTGRLSPDATRIANAITSSGSGRDIWSYDIARKTSIRLSFEGGSDYPIWSPDGRRIVFSSGRDSARGIFSVAADGSQKPQRVLATERPVFPNSHTPDGMTLVYTEPSADGKATLMVLPPGGPPHPLHEATAPESGGEVSADGKWIAYQSMESGIDEVYVQPFPGPGAKVRISTQGGGGARWSRNGRELFYREGNGPAQRIMAVDVKAGPNGFEAGTPHPLFNLNAGSTWDAAGDGKRFLVELIAQSGSGRVNFVTDWFEDLRRRAPARK
jgi:Tol biopolymer transport system component